LAFQIIDGRLHIDPFDIKRGEHVMTIQGSTGIDQSIDYKVKLDVPAPAVAGQAADALSKLVNRSIEEPERLNVKLNLGGTYPKPTVTGGSLGAGGGSLADQAKTKLKDELDKKKQELKDQLDSKKKEAEQKLRDEAERKKRELEEKARQEEARLRDEAERKKQEAEQKAREEADRKKREAEQKAKEEADRLKKEGEQKLKEKLKFPR
jgi:flagellar biosynthesis GTPase FlhF